MGQTNTTQIPSGINNFYDNALLRRAVPLFVHTKYGQVRDIPRNMSSVIRWRRYLSILGTTNVSGQSIANPSTTALSEGITPTGSTLSATDVTATVQQYGDFITLTDFLLFTTLDPILTETAEILGDEAGDTLDRICRNVINAGTTVQYSSESGTTRTSRGALTSTDIIGATEIKKVVRTLRGNNAKKITRMVDPTTGIATTPVNAAYVGIVHPNTTYDLKNVSTFIPVEKYPNQSNVMPGEVGAVDEVRFVESTNASLFAGAGAAGIDVYGTLILAMDAYGVTRIAGEALRNIIKPLGSAGTADPLEQQSTSGWKATFTSAILNNNFIARIEHAVSS